MHVKMLIDRLVTVDGVNSVKAVAGEIYKMGDGVAHDLIQAGHAEATDKAPTKAAVEPAPAPEPAAEESEGEVEVENKDQGAAEEAAAAAKPKRRPAAKKS